MFVFIYIMLFNEQIFCIICLLLCLLGKISGQANPWADSNISCMNTEEISMTSSVENLKILKTG